MGGDGRLRACLASNGGFVGLVDVSTEWGADFSAS